ncbi:uncharacterized protein LOC111050946 [Nilaparvata lugens]|uniref:uncharacterized protein LOC111050946 n=1 Tax=Nilaparvata lugens TaxID=108931 RepID=UPI00193DF236|nr:uncharacterized protein LOC111050946 [Nilaparvata lugens]
MSWQFSTFSSLLLKDTVLTTILLMMDTNLPLDNLQHHHNHPILQSFTGFWMMDSHRLHHNVHHHHHNIHHHHHNVHHQYHNNKHKDKRGKHQRKLQPHDVQRGKGGVTMAPTSKIELFHILDQNKDGRVSRDDYVRIIRGDLYQKNEGVKTFLDKKYRSQERANRFFVFAEFGSYKIDLSELNNGGPFTKDDLVRVFNMRSDIAKKIVENDTNRTITATDLVSHFLARNMMGGEI